MKMLLRSLLLAVLTITAASPQPAPRPNESTGAPPFSLKITARPGRIARVGDRVNLDILLTNTSGRDLEIRGHRRLADDEEVDIRDAQGNEVPQRQPPLQLDRLVYDVLIEPGKVAFDYIPLNTRYDLSKLGQYTISVQRPDADSKVVVKSNTVTLTIAENPPPPFSIRISASPNVAKAGEPVTLDVNLTNTTGEEMRLLGRPAPKGQAVNYKLDIRDAQGQAVPFRKSPPLWPTREGYAGTLAPGQSDRDSIRLDEYYDLGKPGQYTVSAQRSDPETKTVATSNTITLTIAGPSVQPQR